MPFYDGQYAKVAELVDAPGLGPGGVTHGGSIPPLRTTQYLSNINKLLDPLTMLTP